MAITVNDKDLGMVTAYAYALAGGYTGTEAEFETLLGKIAEDLAEIENLSVQVQTLPAGSDATASYAEGVLTLGIPRGDKGETGDQGEIGPTPQLSVGAVTTGEPGTDAEVEITGTPEAPVLNFTIPRGDTGNITQAVRYDAVQTLTDAEKEQARANIDAADAGEVDDLKSALSTESDTVSALANDANIVESYKLSGSGTSGSTAWANTVTTKGVRLRAGVKYLFSAEVETPASQTIYNYIKDSQGNNIKSLNIGSGQTSASVSFTPSTNYDDAYMIFQTGITTGITVSQTVETVQETVSAIELLKESAIQNTLFLPLKNATNQAVTVYDKFYFSIKSGSVLRMRLKNGNASINLIATYADGTTGTVTGFNGNFVKIVTITKDIKLLGYYLPANFDDTLYIYGDFQEELNAEVERISNYSNIKYGAFNINGYVKSDGGFSKDANAKRTDYINVEQFDHVYVDTILGSAGCSIAFYDISKQFISEGSYTGTKRNFTCEIPASAQYVIFSQYSFPAAVGYLYVDGSVARKQILDEQDISNLNTWTRKMFDNDAFGTFAKFGVCGDSLSVGYMDDSHGQAHGRNIYYSWGQVLARRYGNVCLNFGFSGATTKTWYNSPTYGRIEVIEPENLCQCYIIGLGANDSVNVDTVGSASDINLSDYTQNADSFYGNYAKVIQCILATAPQAYVFAFTLPTLYATDLKNDAIRGVITALASDRVFIVDLAKDYKYLYTSEYISGNVVGAHFSAIGYANIAKATAIAISDVMNKNHNAFIDLAFAPYGINDVIN